MLLLLTAAIALVAAELSARYLVSAGGDYVWRPHERMIMELDREQLPGFPAITRFSVNRDGERGDEPPEGDDAWRALVVGGSAVECYFLDQPQSWPEVLANELRRGSFLKRVGCRTLHVGNIGKSGIDSAAVDLIFDRILGRYRGLDCVILCIGAGDVVNWLADGAPEPLTYPGTGSLELFAVTSGKRFGWRPRQSGLAEVVRQVRLRLFPRRRKNAGKKLGEVRMMRRRASTVIETVPEHASMLLNFERNFRSAVAKARSKSRQVVVLRQPWLDRETFTPEEERLLWHAAQGRPYEQQVDTFFSYSVFNSLMHAVDERVAAVSADLGIPALELKKHLSNSMESYYDHAHFTPEGASAVGRAVARFLEDLVARPERSVTRQVMGL